MQKAVHLTRIGGPFVVVSTGHRVHACPLCPIWRLNLYIGYFQVVHWTHFIWPSGHSYQFFLFVDIIILWLLSNGHSEPHGFYSAKGFARDFRWSGQVLRHFWGLCKCHVCHITSNMPLKSGHQTCVIERPGNHILSEMTELFYTWQIRSLLHLYTFWETNIFWGYHCMDLY